MLKNFRRKTNYSPRFKVDFQQNKKKKKKTGLDQKEPLKSMSNLFHISTNNQKEQNRKLAERS